MTTDYAGQLLGGAQPAAPAPTRDYAGDLLGGKPAPTVERESDGASFGALTKAAMVDDQGTKIRIFAKSRFPKDPKAEERYGVMGGEIVFLDDDGKIKKESPTGFSGFAKEVGASILGNAPSVVLGTAGAIVGAPVGPAGSAGLAALGAAGGKGITQSISNLVFDEPQTVGGNIAGMAKEGAIEGAFTFVGSKLAQKIAERSVARDISKLDRTAAESLIEKGRRIGVELNPAQATNLPSLKGRYEVLGRMEPSQDIIDASRVAQGEQAAKAADSFIGRFAPFLSASPHTAGKGAQAGAAAVLDKVATNRAAASKPLYDKAMATAVDVKDEGLLKISGTPAFQSAWERAQRIAANEGVDLGQSANNMRALHYVKLGLDDLIGGAAREGVGSTERRAIIGVKEQLLKFLDKASPDYARARSVYGHYMPTLNANRDGLLGKIAELGEGEYGKAAKMIFNPANSPEDVRNLRSMFFRHDQGQQWNAVLKSYLQETLEQSGREFKSGAGGIRAQAPTWRATLLGNPKQYNVMRAAMTEPEFKALTEMGEVFEAMGRTVGAGGSPTMPLQEAAKNLREDAMGVIPKALAPRQSIRDWLIEARMGKHAEEMARVMTSPDGLNKLRQLKQMSPNDKRFVAGFSSLFGIGDSSDDDLSDKPINARPK